MNRFSLWYREGDPNAKHHGPNAGAWVLAIDRDDYLAMRDQGVDDPSHYLPLEELIALWDARPQVLQDLPGLHPDMMISCPGKEKSGADHHSRPYIVFCSN